MEENNTITAEEREERRKERRYQARLRALDNLYTGIAALLITVLLLGTGIGSLVLKDREYSENENRYLAAKPKMSAESVLDGKFMQDTEAYLADQFIERDLLVSARTGLDIFFGKRDINDVYIGKHHFLIEKPAVYDEARISKTADVINTITQLDPEIRSYIAIAPNACEILADYLPHNAPTQKQTEQVAAIQQKLSGIHCIDLFTPLQSQEKKNGLYYKTDHHWTAQAAELSFDEIAKAMGLDTSAYQNKRYAVSNTFSGTLASSSGVFSAKDVVSITVPQPEVKYVVNYVAENKKTTSVFDSSKLKQKNQYEVFFGGNFAQVRIDTSAGGDRVLLVFKDSYANCVIPMLIPYFKSIVMVDPRYYTDNIEETIAMEGVTDILWLYNTNTLLNDTSIAHMVG